MDRADGLPAEERAARERKYAQLTFQEAWDEVERRGGPEPPAKSSSGSEPGRCSHCREPVNDDMREWLAKQGRPATICSDCERKLTGRHV